jgi:hypothetical protein
VCAAKKKRKKIGETKTNNKKKPKKKTISHILSLHIQKNPRLIIPKTQSGANHTRKMSPQLQTLSPTVKPL